MCKKFLFSITQFNFYLGNLKLSIGNLFHSFLRFLTMPGSFKEPIVVRHGNRVAPPVPSHLPAQLAWIQEPHRSMALLDRQLFVKMGSSIPELPLFPTSLGLPSGNRAGAPLLRNTYFFLLLPPIL